MADIYDVAALRAEMTRLTDELAAIEAKVNPLRGQYDELSQKSAAELKALAEQFKVLEAPLPELKRKIAILARAIGGRS